MNILPPPSHLLNINCGSCQSFNRLSLKHVAFYLKISAVELKRHHARVFSPLLPFLLWPWSRTSCVPEGRLVYPSHLCWRKDVQGTGRCVLSGIFESSTVIRDGLGTSFMICTRLRAFSRDRRAPDGTLDYVNRNVGISIVFAIRSLWLCSQFSKILPSLSRSPDLGLGSRFFTAPEIL